MATIEFVFSDPNPLITKRFKGKLTQEKYPALILHIDGGCEPKNPGGYATSGWALFDPKNPKEALIEEGRVISLPNSTLSTNNSGEYGAIIYSMLWLLLDGWRGELTIKADSNLLVQQVTGCWKVNKPHLKDLRKNTVELIHKCKFHIVTESDPVAPEGKSPCHIIWIPREQNTVANDMCRCAYQNYIARQTKE